MCQCVKILFLPVDHTHEDIIQAFSKPCERLRSSNAATLPNLHSELKMSYRSNARAVHMKSFANWPRLCEKERVLIRMRRFSHFLHFSVTSLRMDKSGNEGVLVTRKVRINCKDY